MKVAHLFMNSKTQNFTYFAENLKGSVVKMKRFMTIRLFGLNS